MGQGHIRKCLDSSELGCHDERRGCCRGVGLFVGEGEVFGVVWDDHADEQDAEAVEEEDSVEGELNGLGDGAAGVLNRLAR